MLCGVQGLTDVVEMEVGIHFLFVVSHSVSSWFGRCVSGSLVMMRFAMSIVWMMMLTQNSLGYLILSVSVSLFPLFHLL